MKVFSSVLVLGLMSSGCLSAARQQVAPKPVLAASAGSVTQTPAGPAQAASTPDATSPSYVIGSDDTLQVTVWKEPTLSGTIPVRPDGMISIALIGDVMAAGRTPMDLSHEITLKLKKFITDPTVNVTVMAVNSKRIFVLGEVMHTGPIPLNSALTPLQAISAAGGLTPFANKKHIYILRGAQGKQTKIPFDYNKAIKEGNLQGVVLMPGDTIVVP